MLDLYLIRHGHAENNVNPKIIGGRALDASLTPLGKKQAAALGQRLKHLDITPNLVYASPAKRTLQTADIALKEAGIKADLTHEEALLELDHGEWEGEVRKEKMVPEWGEEFVAGHGKAPGGESLQEVAKRMHDFALELARRAKSEDLTVLVFGHGTAIRTLLQAIYGFSFMQTMDMHKENTAITQLRYEERYGSYRWRLMRFNDSGHLETLEE